MSMSFWLKLCTKYAPRAKPLVWGCSSQDLRVFFATIATDAFVVVRLGHRSIVWFLKDSMKVIIKSVYFTVSKGPLLILFRVIASPSCLAVRCLIARSVGVLLRFGSGMLTMILVEFVACLSTDAALIAKYLETIVLQVRCVSHSLLGSSLIYSLSLGAMHSRVPHALHFEVAAVTKFEAPVPYVSSRMAVQRNLANSSLCLTLKRSFLSR